MLMLVITCILLLSITWMDFKHRYVYLLIFAGLFIAIFSYSIMQNNWQTIMVQFTINSITVLLVVLVLMLYYRIKEKTAGSFFNQKLGTGDMVFWLCIAPLFSTVNFLLFFISSLLVILCISFCSLLLGKNKDRAIPLAGYQAILLLIVLLINQLFYRYNFSADILSLERLLS
ncbi:MAG: hypothetical protein QM640_17700 [Niabella sp.]